MSDRVRIVRLHQPSGRLWIERDLEIEHGKYQRAAGTFRISASAPTLSTAEQSRSRVAPRTYGRTDPARTATGTWRVRGDTYNECIANAEAILGAVDSGRAGRMIEWRPDGHTVSTLLKVTGPGTWTSNYTWHQFFQNRGIDFDLTWPVEPMSYSQPWDVYDEFDPLADDWNVPATQLLVNANGASPLGTTAGYKTAGPGSAGFINSTYTQEFGIGFTYGGWDQLSGAGFESLVGDPGTGTWTILAPDPTVGSPAFQEAIAPSRQASGTHCAAASSRSLPPRTPAPPSARSPSSPACSAQARAQASNSKPHLSTPAACARRPRPTSPPLSTVSSSTSAASSKSPPASTASARAYRLQ
jgi:hypothetical protein